MNIKKITFDTYMIVNNKLYMRVDAPVDEDISEELDRALTQLNMYEEWVEIEDRQHVTTHNALGEFKFEKSEIEKIVKTHGHIHEE